MYGYSTTAFLELPPEQLGEINLCDVKITDELRKLVAKYQANVKFHQKKSLEILKNDEYFDFVFVDGDHQYNNVVQETELLLRMKPRVITAHDTCLHLKKPAWTTAGPMALRSLVSNHRDYYTIEDCYDRKDERTYRGLFFATTELEVFQDAKRAFTKWTQP